MTPDGQATPVVANALAPHQDAAEQPPPRETKVEAAMPAADIEDKVCRDCGNRGRLIVDRLGHCTTCGSHNVVLWDKLSPKERKQIQNR
jgi:hypothetical protein